MIVGTECENFFNYFMINLDMETVDSQKILEGLNRIYRDVPLKDKPVIIGLTGEREKIRLANEGVICVDKVILKPYSRPSVESALNIS